METSFSKFFFYWPEKGEHWTFDVDMVISAIWALSTIQKIPIKLTWHQYVLWMYMNILKI